MAALARLLTAAVEMAFASPAKVSNNQLLKPNSHSLRQDLTSMMLRLSMASTFQFHLDLLTLRAIFRPTNAELQDLNIQTLRLDLAAGTSTLQVSNTFGLLLVAEAVMVHKMEHVEAIKGVD